MHFSATYQGGDQWSVMQHTVCPSLQYTVYKVHTPCPTSANHWYKCSRVCIISLFALVCTQPSGLLYVCLVLYLYRRYWCTSSLCICHSVFYHLSSHCILACVLFPIGAPILFPFFFLANGLVDQSIPRISNRCTSATPVAPNNFTNSNIPSICTKTLIQCISQEIQCCKNTQTSSSCCNQK